jgi:hypothetical protein
MTNMLEELRKLEEYKKVLEKMSDEEKRQAEVAVVTLIEDFEKNILEPLKKKLENLDKK